ncbi:MAG: BrnT family toxin, partial [Dehalococcoidia bacterium]
VRWRATGMIGPDYITVIFTLRGENRRVISARRASKDERRQYRESSASA